MSQISGSIAVIVLPLARFRPHVITYTNGSRYLCLHCPACGSQRHLSIEKISPLVVARKAVRLLLSGSLFGCRHSDGRAIPPWIWERDYVMRKPERIAGSVSVERFLEENKGKGQPLAGYPNVLEWLVSTSWDDGSERTTSTLLIFLEGGLVKARFTDRDAQQALWLSGDTIKRVLDALEACLERGDGDWRVLQDWKPHQRKK